MNTYPWFPCPHCGAIECIHDDLARGDFWNSLWDRLGVDDTELNSLRMTIKRLMTGGLLGDGIGPGNTARKIHRTLGFALSELEVWAIWRSMVHSRDSRNT